jgi:hypothetical protein
MTIALSWGDDNITDLNNATSGFIYFDAVTAFTQSYTGQVTKHPVDSGGVISDHFIVNNPKFSLSGVITSADISVGVQDIESISGAKPYNVREAPTAVSVNSSNSSMLQKFIPDSVGQFMAPSNPEVVVDSARVNLEENIRDSLTKLIYKATSDDAYVDNKITLVRLFEFDGSVLRRSTTRLVVLDVKFKEDANSGDALYCEISFEQVTFVFLQRTVLPKNIIAKLNKKAAPKVDKGIADSTEETPTAIDRDKQRANYGDVVSQQEYKLGGKLNTGSL